MHRMKATRVIAAASILLNVALGLVSLWPWQQTPREDYPLLAPRIFAESPNDVVINFTDLRNELQSVMEQEKRLRAGIYFEYLPSGVSIGVNEKESFITASLLKVPFLMGIYKLIEQGALREDQVLTVREQHLDRGFGTLWKKGAGTQLTVGEAIRLAVVESDNTATLVLDDEAPTDLIRQVYNALDIPVTIDVGQPVVSPKNYSSVLRCLYLSCFLDYASSQKLLSLLTETIFDEGLPAGVPDGVPVAHKVGFYEVANAPNRVQSDCGIVYVPKRPYILCVFGEVPKGQEYLITELTREVSKRTYRFVSSRE